MPTPSAGDPGKRIAHEGRHKHIWVETLASASAPTVTELAAGFDFTRYVPKDGVDATPSESYIDSADISDSFDSQQVGSWGEQPTLTMYRQDPDDDSFDFFSEYGKKGYWVDIWNGDADSPKDGDLATVRYVECHLAKPLPHAANEKQRFVVGMANLVAPIYDAVVVGS